MKALKERLLALVVDSCALDLVLLWACVANALLFAWCGSWFEAAVFAGFALSLWRIDFLVKKLRDAGIEP